MQFVICCPVCSTNTSQSQIPCRCHARYMANKIDSGVTHNDVVLFGFDVTYIRRQQVALSGRDFSLQQPLDATVVSIHGRNCDLWRTNPPTSQWKGNIYYHNNVCIYRQFLRHVTPVLVYSSLWATPAQDKHTPFTPTALHCGRKPKLSLTL